MSISKGSLKRVNAGGPAMIAGNEEKNKEIQVVFQQIPTKELELDENISIDQELIESIKKWTILVPLMVSVDKNNKLILLSGKKRLKIAKLLEMPTVPCQLIQGASDDQIEEIQEELEHYDQTSIHEEKFKVVSSMRTTLPNYLL